MRARRGLTLIEVMIALVVVAIVFALFLATMREALTTGNTITADADLRGRSQRVLAQMAQELRSTHTGSGGLQISTGLLRGVSFFPIIGATTTPQPGAIYWTTSRRHYEWNSSLGTGNLALSKIILTPHSPPVAVPLTADVTNFEVRALGTTATVGFSTTSPLQLELRIQLTRRGVGQPTATNPDGRISVTVTTNVTVPPG